MSEDCFNCGQPTSEQCTLVLEDSTVLKDKTLCQGCISELQDVEWIGLRDAPVLTRGIE